MSDQNKAKYVNYWIYDSKGVYITYIHISCKIQYLNILAVGFILLNVRFRWTRPWYMNITSLKNRFGGL